MKLDGHCPGCGGGEGNQSCKIAKCSIQHGKIEYCNQCQEFPCDKYGRADEYDIFITHRNWKQDFEKMKVMGVEAYNYGQMQKLEILNLLSGGQPPGFRRFENSGRASCGRKTVGKFYAERKVSFCGKAAPVHSRAAGRSAEME